MTTTMDSISNVVSESFSPAPQNLNPASNDYNGPASRTVTITMFDEGKTDFGVAITDTVHKKKWTIPGRAAISIDKGGQEKVEPESDFITGRHSHRKERKSDEWAMVSTTQADHTITLLDRYPFRQLTISYARCTGRMVFSQKTREPKHGGWIEKVVETVIEPGRNEMFHYGAQYAKGYITRTDEKTVEIKYFYPVQVVEAKPVSDSLYGGSRGGSGYGPSTSSSTSTGNLATKVCIFG